METLYLFKNEYEIEGYTGEILFKKSGTKVKALINPSEDELKSLGYKPLIIEEYPELKKGYGYETYYQEESDAIKECHRLVKIVS